MVTGTAGATITQSLYITYNHNSTEIGGKSEMPSREEMIEYITGCLAGADDSQLEQYYWFFMYEEEL